MQIKKIHKLFLLLCIVLCYSSANAHGGVFLEDDLCLIQIGFHKAHFTIYQPQKSQHKEFCEDIPHATESIFVMEYLHNNLRNKPVDFRIIKDVQNRGRFVKWQDLQSIENFDDITEFYQPPVIREDGVFLALHEFKEEGNYIGIVMTKNQDNSEAYTAVFPFRVGGQSWGYIPWFIAIALFLQLNYWLLSGGYSRIRKLFSSNFKKDLSQK